MAQKQNNDRIYNMISLFFVTLSIIWVIIVIVLVVTS